MVEHYNKRIQNIIQKELFKAKDSIKIAVAWFTNELLFEPLLLKLQTGVTVELVLNKDEINNSEENDINFSEFVDNGGVLHWNDSNRLMHEKYCIIDNKIVIYGSYNWTNKAEFNDESIAISRDEQNTTDFYLKSFGMLCSRYPAEAKQEQTVKKSEKSQSTENATYTKENGKIVCQCKRYNSYRILYDLYEFKDTQNSCQSIFRLYDRNKESFMEYVFSDFIPFKDDLGLNWEIALLYKGGWYIFNGKRFLKLAANGTRIELGPNGGGCIAIRDLQNGKWGVSDYNGNFMVPCDYDEVKFWSISDGVSYWILKKDNLYGLSEGYKIKHDCIFDKLSNPKEPAILAGDYGWLDDKGEVLVDFLYNNIIEEDFLDSNFRHFAPSYITKSKEGFYGICTPGYGIEKKDVIRGKDLFDKIGIPEFNICEKQTNKVLEELRRSLILDILHEAYDFNHDPWAIDREKRFLKSSNKDLCGFNYIGEDGKRDVRKIYFEEGTRYIDAPFFYLADKEHICLDVHHFHFGREDWRMEYNWVFGGYNVRICEMSRELQENDIIIISKNTKMLSRINERFYFCIIQVVNLSTTSTRYIAFNFNLLYSRSDYDKDDKSLNGSGNVTLQMEQMIREYKYDYINLLTKGRTQDTFIKLSNLKEKICVNTLIRYDPECLRKVHQFSYDYATDDEIRKVKEIIIGD